MVALAVTLLVVALRVTARIGTAVVAKAAQGASVPNPFSLEKAFASNAIVSVSNTPAKVLDSAAIETLINSKIPTKAERAAARAALDAYMAQ
jgi:hypothetical protein